MRIFTLFGSTYIFEQTFTRINYVKCSERSRLTDEHLHLLRIGVSTFQTKRVSCCFISLPESWIPIQNASLNPSIPVK